MVDKEYMITYEDAEELVNGYLDEDDPEGDIFLAPWEGAFELVAFAQENNIDNVYLTLTDAKRLSKEYDIPFLKGE